MPLTLKVFLALWFVAFGFEYIRTRDQRIVKLLLVSMLTVIGLFVVGLALVLVKGITPKYDQWLYKADGFFGSPSPAYYVSRMLLDTWMTPVLNAVYEAMPVTLLFVYAWHLLRAGNPTRVLIAFGVNFAVGYCLYFLLPSCGPGYVFTAFPRVLPTVGELHTMAVACNPNCMPSLHTSTAILAACLTWRWRILRLPAILNLVGTLAATLMTGEHYLIDLVVAVPYAAFVYAAALGNLQAAAKRLAFVMASILIIRVGFSPGWIFAGALILFVRNFPMLLWVAKPRETCYHSGLKRA